VEGVAVVEAAVVGWRVLTIEWFGEGGGCGPFLFMRILCISLPDPTSCPWVVTVRVLLEKR